MKNSISAVLFFLCMCILVHADSTHIMDKINDLKMRSVELDARVAELRKHEMGDLYKEDNFLTDFFMIVEQGEKDYPDALNAEEKQFMLQLLSQMQKTFERAENSDRPDIVEVTYESVCEKVDMIYEKILSVPYMSQIPAEKSVRKTAVVSVSQAHVRENHGTQYAHVATVYQGNRLPVLDDWYDNSESKTWYKIKTPGGRKGWISEKCVNIEGSNDGGNSGGTVQGYVTCTIHSANVRRTPSLSGTVVGTAFDGEKMPYYKKQYAESRNWYNVKIKNGTIGWISEKCLNVYDGGDGGNNTPSGQAGRNVKYANQAIGASGTLYGYKVYNADTQWGRLACAAVVSAIIIKAKAGIVYEQYCPTLKNKLKNKGWDCYYHSSWKAGDVIFWRKRKTGTFEQKREKHTGVIVGRSKYRGWMTVDNSSSRKKVVKRALNRPGTYPVNGPACRP